MERDLGIDNDDLRNKELDRLLGEYSRLQTEGNRLQNAVEENKRAQMIAKNKLTEFYNRK